MVGDLEEYCNWFWRNELNGLWGKGQRKVNAEKISEVFDVILKELKSLFVSLKVKWTRIELTSPQLY